MRGWQEKICMPLAQGNWEQHNPFTKKELKENKKMHKTNKQNVVTMVSMKGE